MRHEDEEVRLEAADIAEQFLGLKSVTFAAIDGTEYTSRMFDIVVFFGGSYATKGTIELSRNPPQTQYTQRLMKEGVGVSTCIPMYVNQKVCRDSLLSSFGQSICEQRPPRAFLGPLAPRYETLIHQFVQVPPEGIE